MNMKEWYEDAQTKWIEVLNLQFGDRVMVKRLGERDELGWRNLWNKQKEF